jgi:hypothetical protein
VRIVTLRVGARAGAIAGRVIALSDVFSAPSADLLRGAARSPPGRGTGRGRGRIGTDPTASDPAPDALIETQDRPTPAGTALEEDRMRNRAW